MRNEKDSKAEDLKKFIKILIKFGLTFSIVILILMAYLFFYQHFNDPYSNNFTITLYPLKPIIKDLKIEANNENVNLNFTFEPLLKNFRIDNEVTKLPSLIVIVQTISDSTGNIIDNKTISIKNKTTFTTFQPIYEGTYQIKLSNLNSSAIEGKGNIYGASIISNTYSLIQSLIKGLAIIVSILFVFAFIIYIWIRLKIPMT